MNNALNAVYKLCVQSKTKIAFGTDYRMHSYHIIWQTYCFFNLLAISLI